VHKSGKTFLFFRLIAFLFAGIIRNNTESEKSKKIKENFYEKNI